MDKMERRLFTVYGELAVEVAPDDKIRVNENKVSVGDTTIVVTNETLAVMVANLIRQKIESCVVKCVVRWGVDSDGYEVATIITK